MSLSDTTETADDAFMLVKKVGEAELQHRIQELEKQLQEARRSLDLMGGSTTTTATATRNHVNGNESNRAVSSPSSSAAAIITTALPPVVLSKRGYLFKWADRTIGWGGTKWALRFVVLEGGKISYFRDHSDISPRYVMTLRGCAVRDEGLKPNKRHRRSSMGGRGSVAAAAAPPLDETGAYFHVFSIYQRADSYHDDYGQDDDMNESSSSSSSSSSSPPEVVPLLRFSTPSLAEKTQWMKLISEACEYCDTEEFVAAEMAASIEAQRRKRQEEEMQKAMPEARRGTLPPLYFAPPAPTPMKRVPSGYVKRPRLYRTTSGNLDADKVESRSTKGYPPSKPMHRASAPSYLSTEAPTQSYRGFFNLALILLVVSNFRLLLDTVKSEGFILAQLPHMMPRLTSRDPWDDSPLFSGFLLLQVFIVTTYFIERLLSRGLLNETFGMLWHYVNAHACLLVSTAVVWNFIDSPVIGGTLMLHSTITWMKLLSYVHANQDYRLSTDVDTYKATLALMEDLDVSDANLSYPKNITISNMYYFWFAPTLTYQIAFPRTPKVRFWKVMSILVRMLCTVTLFAFLVAQVISPNLANLVKDLEVSHGVYTASMLAHYGLKLSIANTYAWLLVFYYYFHLYLNLFAELLRFGDRVFYKDWWNSSEVSAYWRLWNMPVHYWLIRHLYFPCVRMGIPKAGATLIVFLLSAVLHEVLISVPFHMIRPWSFLGMVAQIPLVAITKYLWKKLPGSSIGNVIFWLSFCVVGQPMAILLYTIDYQYGQQTYELTGVKENVHLCRLPWKFWVNRCAAAEGQSGAFGGLGEL